MARIPDRKELRLKAQEAVAELKKLQELDASLAGHVVYAQWRREKEWKAVVVDSRMHLPMASALGKSTPVEFATVEEFDRISLDGGLPYVGGPHLACTCVYLAPDVSSFPLMGIRVDRTEYICDTVVNLSMPHAFTSMDPLRVPLQCAILDTLPSLPEELVRLVVSFLAIPSELIADPAKQWLAHYVDVRTTANLKNVRDRDVTSTDGGAHEPVRKKVRT